MICFCYFYQENIFPLWVMHIHANFLTSVFQGKEIRKKSTKNKWFQFAATQVVLVKNLWNKKK